MSESKEWEQLNDLYDRIEDRSVDGVFTGSLMEIYRESSVSSNRYSKFYALLIELGSLERLQQGNSRQPSRIRVIAPPSRERYDVWVTAHDYDPLTAAPSRATLSKRLTAIERRLPEIDIRSYIVSIEDRLAKIEAELAEVRGAAHASHQESTSN